MEYRGLFRAHERFETLGYNKWYDEAKRAHWRSISLPRRSYNNGEFYYRINAGLNRLKKELETDLVMVDGFMWYVDKEL
ncbi:MAG: hypothetical protein QW057_01620 [Candidatus Bathyarchaeia archaeon]